jgi:hypothetical protein
VPDLYGVLDVPKTAARDAIRKAYRKRAKTAHPDRGGTRESFALVTLAHAILSDDERRAKYDATGDCSEASPDNSVQAAMELLAKAVGTAMQTYGNGRIDPTTMNVARDLEAHITGWLGKIMTEKQGALQARKMAEKMIGRFKRKQKRGTPPKPNFLDRLMQDQLKAISAAIEGLEKQEATHRAAIEMAREYDFTHDAPKSGTIVWQRLSTSTGASR